MRRPLAFFCALFCCFIFLLVSAGVLPFGKKDLPLTDGEYVYLQGRAEKTAGKYMLITGCVENTDDLRADEISLFVKAEDTEYLSLGEKIVIRGKVRLFSHAMNPGEFDAYDYYTAKGGDAFLRDAYICEKKGGIYPVREGLRRFREKLKMRLYAICPQKEASVLSDLLLGDKEGIDEEINELYKNNGIAHILSISGLHISILGMGLFKILRKCRMKQVSAAMVSALVLLLYGIMTGMSVSAERAIGMFIIRMFAYPAKRTADPLTSLMVMAFVSVLMNPLNICQAGFLLSYGAALGIIIFLPRFEAIAAVSRRRTFRAGRSPFIKRLLDKLLSSLRASFAISLFTLPIQLYFFYRVSVYSVILNLIILPCMSLLVFCAMVSLIPGLGIFASVSCFLLDVFERLCRCAEKLPFHTYNPGRPGAVFIIFYYVCIIFIILWVNRRTSLFLTVGLMLFLTALPLPVKNSMTQLYVGQGNCNITITDAGEVYMFDAGSTSKSEIGKYTILPYMRFNGLTRLDAVFISHPDEDHINGAQELIENSKEWGIRVLSVYVTPQTYESKDTENAAKLIDACKKSGVDVRIIKANDEWNSGDTHFICLHPSEDYIPEDANSGSMCILAEFMGPGRKAGDPNSCMSVLIPGDVQGSGEDALCRALEKYLSEAVPGSEVSYGSRRESSASEPSSGSRRLDIYITAHHGSSGTTTDEFLDIARPYLAINSAGENNRYHHPHEETLRRFESHGTAYLTTYETGAVTILPDFSCENPIKLVKYMGCAGS